MLETTQDWVELQIVRGGETIEISVYFDVDAEHNMEIESIDPPGIELSDHEEAQAYEQMGAHLATYGSAADNYYEED